MILFRSAAGLFQHAGRFRQDDGGDASRCVLPKVEEVGVLSLHLPQGDYFF